MVDDVALWFLLAASIAFIWCGCILTARNKSTFRLNHDPFDRAA